MAKITYENKEFLNKNENIADKNKVNDSDLNEIKEVVNSTYYAGYTETAVADANEITETGGYYTNANTLNLPINGSGGFLNVMYRSDDNITQTWTRYRDNQAFMRQYNSVNSLGWKEWRAIVTEPTVLYENANGSNGNITLNDSVENYRYIEVYYRNNDNRYNSKKFYKINGKYVVLDSYYSASNDIVWKQQTRLFDGKQFNVISNAEVSNAAISYIKTSSNTFVMLIIGYK